MEKLTYVVGISDGLEYSAIIQTLPGLEAMADPKTGKFDAVRAAAVKAAIAPLRNVFLGHHSEA